VPYKDLSFFNRAADINKTLSQTVAVASRVRAVPGSWASVGSLAHMAMQYHYQVMNLASSSPGVWSRTGDEAAKTRVAAWSQTLRCCRPGVLLSHDIYYLAGWARSAQRDKIPATSATASKRAGWTATSERKDGTDRNAAYAHGTGVLK
jgi:hypothetical protein